MWPNSGCDGPREQVLSRYSTFALAIVKTKNHFFRGFSGERKNTVVTTSKRSFFKKTKTTPVAGSKGRKTSDLTIYNTSKIGIGTPKRPQKFGFSKV